ncbi:MAG: HEAT repeat domain-containing protein [Planctomycetota bacterium]
MVAHLILAIALSPSWICPLVAQEPPPKKNTPKIGPKHRGLEPQGPVGRPAKDAKEDPSAKPTQDVDIAELENLLPPETARETWAAKFLINGLKGWPDEMAKTNADILVSRGEENLEEIREAFRNVTTPRLRAALAEILGRLRDDVSYNSLVRAIETLAGREFPVVYFRAMMLIDRTRAIEDVARLLEHRITGLRNSAEAFLTDNLRPEESTVIERYVTAKKTSVRVRALQILEKVAPLQSIEHFLAGLGHEETPLAQLCLERLAEVSDPQILERLVAEARSFPSRRGSYATLVLLLREERHGDELLQPADIARYRPSLLRSDPLEAGVAALVLATVGYRSEDASHARALNRDVPTALLAALAARGYYRDYGAIAPLVATRLELLSGEGFDRDVRGWVTWWEQNKDEFRARRRLFTIAPGDAGHVVLYYYRGGGRTGDSLNNLLFRGLELQESRAIEGEIILSNDEMMKTVAMIEALHLFQRPAARQADVGSGFRELRVQLFNFERTWVFEEPLPEELGTLELALIDQAHDNRWQRYWDQGTQPDFRAWLEDNWSWWGDEHTELEEQRRLKKMILDSYAYLEGDSRKLAALEELDRLMSTHQVPEPGDAVTMLFRLRDETHPERLTRWVEVICKTPEEMVFKPLTVFLARLPHGAAVPLLDKVLAVYPARETLTLLDSERSVLRQAAAGNLWRYPGAETEARLLTLLEDADVAVRRGACWSLGRLEVEAALDPLLARLPVAEPSEREAICEALGRIGGEAAAAALAIASLEGPLDQRLAAVHGLGFLDGMIGGGPLVDAYVLNVGSEAGRLAEQLLRQRQDAITDETLRSYLGSEVFPARRAAALTLGRRGDRAAIGVLVECDRIAVESDPDIRSVLANLTAYAPLVEGASYTLWWANNRDRHPALWVVDALQREGVEVPSDPPVRIDDHPNPEVIELLLMATAQEWSPLRSLASRVLSELLEVPPPAAGSAESASALRDHWDAVWAQHPARKL